MPARGLTPVTSWEANIRERDPREYLAELLYEREGMVMAITFSAPRASTARASVKALSMPPDEPSTACLNPQRRA